MAPHPMSKFTLTGSTCCLPPGLSEEASFGAWRGFLILAGVSVISSKADLSKKSQVYRRQF